ncbi:centromere protein X-like [Homarus americanus]|uniref:centromere protein X-like n=1 Tax=Homarus americanus TaxID=6706 RepID=UPI001C44FD28|nr:centromere protein X-like [Homarus americanus]XP_042211591.1 centromere protein X-like [Homarus americanus]XP_042211592.1 centromere protein X-like [Homarus americanus]
MKFSEKLIYEFMKFHFEKSNTRINADAIKLVAKIMELVAKEGATRAAYQAKQEGADTVTVEHLEKVLAQLLLDL